MNNVNLIGRVANDIEMKHTSNGVAVVSFNLAVFRTKDKQGNDVTDFVPCVIWREYAAMMSRYIKKGQQIGISGKITTRTYENQSGEKRKVVEVTVDTVTLLGKKEDNAKKEPENNTDYYAKADNAVPANTEQPVPPPYYQYDDSMMPDPLPDFVGES